MPRARGDMEVGAVGPGVSVAACSQCLFTVKIYPNRIDSIPWSGPETGRECMSVRGGRTSP